MDDEIRTGFYIHRYVCDVLSEMRDCCKTGNYSYLPGLIEEAQSMANRMESALGVKKDIPQMIETWHELKRRVKKENKRLKKLQRKTKKIAS